MVGERQRNSRGTAWERHGMCESALSVRPREIRSGVGGVGGKNKLRIRWEKNELALGA
jgi:hypothetical protein